MYFTEHFLKIVWRAICNIHLSSCDLWLSPSERWRFCSQNQPPFRKKGSFRIAKATVSPMDRRQRKSREAIFRAFTRLLEKQAYHQITVQNIIDEADVGRTTFYAHFETKDYLLKDLCDELFGHIIDTAMGLPHGHGHYSCCTTTDSVFLHLLRHLQENDRNILALLSSQNNEIFLRYFKTNLKKLIKTQFADTGKLKESKLPEDLLVNHISVSFVEMVSWWLSHGTKETPEELAEYFEDIIVPLM